MHLNVIPLFLVLLILLGVLSNNQSITISATVLLLMQQTVLARYIPLAEQYGIQAGIILLTIGVLSPLVSGRIQFPGLAGLMSWKMLVAWLAGRGVPLMSEQPVLVTGLLLGTIIGVAFLGGIPVGPLIAAGILSLIAGKV